MIQLSRSCVISVFPQDTDCVDIRWMDIEEVSGVYGGYQKVPLVYVFFFPFPPLLEILLSNEEYPCAYSVPTTMGISNGIHKGSHF